MAARELAAVIRARDESSHEFDRIRSSLAQLERQASQTSGTLASSGGGAESFVTGVGKIATGVGAALVALRALEEAKSAVFGAAFGTNASLETAELQFKVLIGDADTAKSHVADLFNFAKETPFEAGPVIEASRSLRAAGGAALDTKENLRLVGDAAAATSSDIREVSLWVGRAYAQIQAGRPFGEAAQRLGELAIISPQARIELERMSEAGVTGERVWGKFQSELGKFSGGMRELAGTWTGITSTLKDTLNLMAAGAAKPVFEEVKAQLQEINKWLESPSAKQFGENIASGLRGARDELKKLNEERQQIGQNTELPRAIIGLPFGVTTGQDVARAAGATRALTDGQQNLMNEALSSFKEGSAEWRAEYERLLNFFDEENRRLTQTQRNAATGLKLPNGAELLAQRFDAFQASKQQAADQINKDFDDIAKVLDVGRLAQTMSSAGFAVFDAVQKELRDSGVKTKEVAVETAIAFEEAIMKGLDPAAARDAVEGFWAAWMLAQSERSPEALQQFQDIVSNIGGQIRDKRLADDAKAAAEKLKRDQAAAVNEAKRIADEWRRTMPITTENFSAEFARSAQATSFGPGRGMFEGLRKAIEEGGEQNIQAVARMAAEMAQRMRDEFKTSDGEDWARELMQRVNQAIVGRTPESIAAVAEWVKAFDIEAQIRTASQRAQEAIDDAIKGANRQIERAESDAEKRVARMRADFALAAERDAERERLQRNIETGLQEFQSGQRLTGLGRGEGREDAARELALSRENADLDLRRAREEAASTRQQALQDADIARQQARQIGDSGTSRARQDRDSQIQVNRTREDMEREHQTRLADIAKQGGPNQAQAIAAENESFKRQQENVARQRQRADEDRARQRADEDADRQKARARSTEDLARAREQIRAEMQIRRELEGADLEERRARETTDRETRRQQARDDLNQAIADDKALQTERDRLGEPLKNFLETIKSEDLERSISDVYEALGQTIADINQSIAETIERETAAVDKLRQKLEGIAPILTPVTNPGETGGDAAVEARSGGRAVSGTFINYGNVNGVDPATVVEATVQAALNSVAAG